MAKWTMKRTDPNCAPDCSLVCAGNGVEVHVDYCCNDVDSWLLTEWRDGKIWLASSTWFCELRDAMAEAERLCGEVTT